MFTWFQRLFATPTERLSAPVALGWLAASLAASALFGLLALMQAFSGPHVVQDDARQHVFWMRRFLDPGLFPGDLIADYFQAAAPPAYALFYRGLALIGIDPLLASKLLPTGLGLLTAGFGFAFTLRLFALPAAAFFASFLLSYHLWSHDTLASATSRAFIYPLFMAVLCLWAWRARTACLLAVVLLVLFYPPFGLVVAGLFALGLLGYEGGRLRWARDRFTVTTSLAGIAIVVVSLAYYVLRTSPYGPVITQAEAEVVSAFNPGSPLLVSTEFWNFWVTGGRTGMLPYLENTSPWFLTALLLPLLWAARRHFPLLAERPAGPALLVRITVVSLLLFAVAHLVLYRLYLPNRYTMHTLWIVAAVAGGGGLGLAIEALFRRAGAQRIPRRLAVGAAVALTAALVASPAWDRQFLRVGYVRAAEPALMDFLAKLPPEAVIGSISEEASNVPSFARRSVLAAREYQVSYHEGYRRPFRRRGYDLARAQYSPDRAEVLAIARRHRLSHWLLDREAFTPQYVEAHPWLGQFQLVRGPALARLRVGQLPALADPPAAAIVYESERFLVLELDRLSAAWGGRGTLRPDQQAYVAGP